MLVLSAAALAAGFAVNQVNDQGIPWRLLVPAFSRDRIPARLGYLSVETMQHLLESEGAMVWDIRPADDYRIDHIPNAESVPFIDFLRRPARYPLPDRKDVLIVYDFEPGSPRARILGRWLVRQGLVQTRMLYPGFSGWLEAGLPVEKGGSR